MDLAPFLRLQPSWTWRVAVAFLLGAVIVAFRVRVFAARVRVAFNLTFFAFGGFRGPASFAVAARAVWVFRWRLDGCRPVTALRRSRGFSVYRLVEIAPCLPSDCEHCQHYKCQQCSKEHFLSHNKLLRERVENGRGLRFLYSRCYRAKAGRSIKRGEKLGKQAVTARSYPPASCRRCCPRCLCSTRATRRL